MTASAIRSATGCATPLTRLRRALPPVLLPILALGTFASIDALQTQMRLPDLKVEKYTLTHFPAFKD